MIEKNDSFLKEAGVKFLPFVGDNYENGISFDEEGRLILGTAEKPGKKVLIINQCHYCDEDLTDEEMSSFTRDVFERRFASYTNANSNKGNMVFSEKVFFLTLERIMTGQVNGHSNSFWEYIMFYTYVQDIVRQPTEIAKDTDYSAPFFRLLDLYKPDCVIVLGYHLYEILPIENGYQGNQLDFDGSETWIYDLDGCKIQVFPINNLSRIYACDSWHWSIVELFKRVE